ncbi:MAG: PEGA domain-containing protein [Polyangiaceae bacterium]
MDLHLRRSIGVAFFLIAWGTQASAQPAPPQSTAPDAPAPPSTTTQQAVAQTLFDQGKKLMQDQRYVEACAKFADSNRLAPGTGTLLNLAECHAKVGKLATAWVEMNNAADGDRRAGNAQRLAWIEGQIQTLAPQLAHLTVTVVPATPSGFRAELDGVAIDPAAYGAPTPVDPGTHTVTASAPGYDTWSAQVAIAQNGETKSIDVPILSSQSATGQPPPSASPSEAEKAPARDDGSIDKTKRIAAYALGGVAVVGLGVGTIFGIETLSDWSDRNANCPGGRCNQTAVDDYSSAKTAAILSDVSFGVAVVAAAAGTYLFLTSKKSHSSIAISATPMPGGGAASVSARF